MTPPGKYRPSKTTQQAVGVERNMDGTPLYTAEAIEHIRDLCEFAYERGYHELGYDPVKTIEKALANAREFVTARWPYPNNEGLEIALSDLGKPDLSKQQDKKS